LPSTSAVSNNLRNHQPTPSLTFLNSNSNSNSNSRSNSSSSSNSSSNSSSSNNDNILTSSDSLPIDIHSNEIETSAEQRDYNSEKQLLLEKALPKLKEIQARHPTVSPLDLMRRYKKLAAEGEKTAEKQLHYKKEKEAERKEEDGASGRPSVTYTTAASFRYSQASEG
jgi:hypothetical protein